MNQHLQHSADFLYQKFQRVYRKLQQLLQSGKDVPAEKIRSLTKRFTRYAKELATSHPLLLKTGGAMALSLFLSAQSGAQSCNVFSNADIVNPVRRAGLPQDLIQPTFVDIDGDGDLDCYESNKNRNDGGGSYEKVTFLRNTGNKKQPYFEVDTATGFGKLPNIPIAYNTDGDRLNFVDIDGDGDYDCFIGKYENSRSVVTLYYKNVGTKAEPKFVYTPSESPLGGKGARYGLQISFADLDNDGDYDCTFGDLYHTEILKNVGTATQGAFQTVEYTTLSYLGRVTLYDYDKDGLTDIFIGYDGSPAFYQNVGTPAKPKFKENEAGAPVFPSSFHRLYTFVDLNKDGFPEAYSVDGNYLTTTPIATIARVTDSDPDDYPTLQAYPDSAVYIYRWRKDGILIPGATSPVFHTSSAGSYTVEITGSCGSGNSLPYIVNDGLMANSANLRFTSSLPTGLQPSLKAYPNPFTQQFILHLGDDNSNTVVKISDVQGRIISTIKAGNSTLQLCGNLPKGVYLLQVIKDNKVTFVQKLIKQ